MCASGTLRIAGVKAQKAAQVDKSTTSTPPIRNFGMDSFMIGQTLRQPLGERMPLACLPMAIGLPLSLQGQAALTMPIVSGGSLGQLAARAVQQRAPPPVIAHAVRAP